MNSTRAKLLIVSMLLTFILTRAWLYYFPGSDFYIGSYNIHHLFTLMILGGEPFTQPQSDILLDFLETKKCPELKLVFFSNLSINTDVMKKRFIKMQNLKKNLAFWVLKINSPPYPKITVEHEAYNFLISDLKLSFSL